MPTTHETVTQKYLRFGNPTQRTREEYATTIRKWKRWGGGVPREMKFESFWIGSTKTLSKQHGTNAGRAANKVRSHLRAVLS